MTAYLVAITPDLQQSYKARKNQQRAQQQAVKDVRAAIGEAPAAPAAPDAAAGDELLEEKCTDCHELTDIEEHGKDTREGWTKVVTTMVEDEGAELSRDEARQIIAHLVATRGK